MLSAKNMFTTDAKYGKNVTTAKRRNIHTYTLFMLEFPE